MIKVLEALEQATDKLLKNSGTIKYYLPLENGGKMPQQIVIKHRKCDSITNPIKG